MSSGHSAEGSVTVHVESLLDTDSDDMLAALFTARGSVAPAVWAPVLGSPRPVPLFPDGPGLWRRELRIRRDAPASWALIPDVRRTRLSPSQRFRALISHEARNALAIRMDEAFRAPNPVAPSLYRLIGSDPRASLTANIGIIPTPGALLFSTLSSLTEPAAEGDEQLVSGHRLTHVGQGSEHGSALFFDGEVLRRFDADLAGTGWSRMYLDNHSAVGRLRNHAHPRAFVRSLETLNARLHEPPRVIVGVSAAAPTALALAMALEARQAVLLSPAFPHTKLRQELAKEAASQGLIVDVRAGSEENGGGDERRSIRRNAEAFAADINHAGGSAVFSEFSGGHDLAAWCHVLLHALNDAAQRQKAPPTEGNPQ